MCHSMLMKGIKDAGTAATFALGGVANLGITSASRARLGPAGGGLG